MMKQWIMVVVLLLAFGSSAYGSESLSDALTKGKFNGAVKFLYLTGSNTDVVAAKGSDDRKTGSVAAEINYLTGDFYGFKLGAGAQSGWDLSFHDEDGSSEDDTRNSITSTNIHQAFLSYGFQKSSVTIGRQIIKTPLLMNSSVFPLKDSFDAVEVSTAWIPKTIVKGYYINQWNKRYANNSNYSFVQEDAKYSDGLYSLFISNKSIDNLTLTGQYMTTEEDSRNGDLPVITQGGYDQYFVKGAYKLPISFPLSLGAVIGGASFDSSTEKDASIYGFQIGTKLADVALSAAYTSVDDDHDYPGTLGHVPDVVLYTNGLLNNAVYAGLEAVALQAKYNFGIEAFSARLKLIHFEQSDEGISRSAKNIGDANEVNLDLKYSFSGSLKGFSTRLFMGYADYDQDVDEDTNAYARFYLTYAF